MGFFNFRWIAILVGLAAPIMLLWCFLVFLVARRFGIRRNLHWPNSGGKSKAAAEIGALTKKQYVLTQGVVGYGVGIALYLNIAFYIGHLAGIESVSWTYEHLLMFIFFPLFGVWFGTLMWRDRTPPQ